VINPNTGEDMTAILGKAYASQDIELDGDLGFDFSAVQDVRTAVFQTIGAASVCWEDVPTGIFNSDRAASLGEGLVAWLEDHYGSRSG